MKKAPSSRTCRAWGTCRGIDDTIKTGVKDAAGKDIVKKTGYKLNQVDETAWCACLVNWCLKEAGEAVLKDEAAGAQYCRPTEREVN